MNIYWEEYEMGEIPEEKGNNLTAKGLEEVNGVELGVKNPSGGYDITGIGGGPKSFLIMFDKKPRLVHRIFSKLFLGWVWVDKK